MKTLKQTLELFIIGLTLGILLYGLVEHLIGLGLTVGVIYYLYKRFGQKMTTKGGAHHG